MWDSALGLLNFV